jgi:putative glutamine amidotransferase
MKYKAIALTLCAQFISCFAFAESIRLVEWNPGKSLAPLILPVRESETPKEAANRYLRELDRNADLMELFEGRLPEVKTDSFSPLDQSNREHRALLIANLPKDYGQNTVRVQNFIKIFSQARHRSYILPINANLGLSQEETRDLFKQISEKFPLMVAMGGDDVDTSLYNKENIHSRNTILARDKFEASLIKSYVSHGKGFLLSICRGSQITSVALGYGLIQDVPLQVGKDVTHNNEWHDIEMKTTTNNILKTILGDQGTRIKVNSFHHQSLIYREGGPLELAAIAPDGVVEATELKNGRGLLLQFHPELMENDLGNKILWRALSQKAKVMAPSCSKVFR